MTIPWLAIVHSLEVALAATVLATLVGIPLAVVLARSARGWRTVVTAVIFLPLVLPPTVIGYALLYLLGKHGLWGWAFGGSLLFTKSAAVAASTIVALPLLTLPARSAFANQPRHVLDEARLAGANVWQTFFQITLPLALPNVLAGMLLAFGRALGEFGATLMVVGTGEATRTLPIQIYFDAGMDDNMRDAAPAVLALAAVGFLITLVTARRLLSTPIDGG
jgi:molybdate transport system permease protein